MKKPLIGATCVAVLIAAGAQTATAHGTRPRAVEYYRSSTGLQSLTTIVRGAYVSAVEGEDFGWICAEAISEGPGDEINAAFRLDNEDWVVASSAGLKISRDGGCSWDELEGPWGNLRLGHAAPDPRDGQRIWVSTTSGGDVINGVWRSDDGGRSWNEEGLSGTPFFRTIAIHPATGRVYVVAFDVNNEEYFLAFTDNDGDEWTERTLPDPGQGSYRIVALDPHNDHRIFLKAIDTNGATLYISPDAGRTAEPVLTSTGDLHNMVFDGDRLILGRDGGGVWNSNDGGATWTDGDSDPGMYCLSEYGGEQYRCLDVRDQAVIGRMTGDADFEPVFTYDDISGLLECPAGTTVAEACTEPIWNEHVREMGEWGVELGNSDDDNNDSDSGGGGGSGGCNQSRSSGGWTALLVLLFSAIALRPRSKA